MKNYFSRINTWYKLTVIVSVLLCLYFLVFNFLHPYIGAIVDEKKDGKYIISDVEPQTWASSVGLKIGDEVLVVNNESPSNHQPIIRDRKLERVQSFTIDSNGVIRNFEVEDTLINSQSFFIVVLPLVLMVLCLFCSYFLYRSNRKLNLLSAFILNAFLLNIALAHFSAGVSARADVFARYANIVFFLLTPVLYLHFIYQYFKEYGRLLFSKWFLVFGYGITLFNLIIEFPRYDYSSYNFTKISNLITFGTLIILVFVLIMRSLKKIRYTDQKYLLKVLIVTNFMAFFPFILLYLIPFLIFNKHIFPPTILAAFILLIPFSLVYQFVATKIYDIEFILGRVRYYALLAVLPTAICLGAILLLEESDTSFYLVKLTIFIYITVILMFYFKEILDFRFKLKRFSEKYNYQDSIFKYTDQISKSVNLVQVITHLKKTITDVLLVSKAYFIEADTQGNVLLQTEEEVMNYVKEIPFTLSEIGKIKEVDKGFLIKIGETEDRNYILLCLSTINTPKLTRDEISWLKALSFYTHVSLENFLKIEELMNHLETVQKEGTNPSWLTKLFFSIEEKQRSNLAKDLHDSVLQDLISLKRQCEVALVELEAAPADLKNQLEDMNENMTKIIKTTRETCQELRPQLLYDLGLVKALNKLVTQYQEFADFEIRMNAGKFQTNTDIDVQLNLYRIIQELLTNAHKHSHASNVLIMLVCIKDKIVLHYEDDGIGFDQNEIIYNSESMGLSGISERVKALKGTLTIETSKGEGFKAVIEI
ncbi:histidine kinase [Metabacillus sp. 84]|uniref:histidine kinase n=1 Tax=unclassified Metabacillus TaxID=2675274 RepID=UPI003CEA19EE